MATALAPARNVDAFAIDGQRLTVGDVVAVARGRTRERVALCADAVRRMAASQQLKDTLVAAGQPVYGVTSGFGDSSSRQVSSRRSRELQQNLIRFLSAGTGPCAPPDVVRATMLIRANCLARGSSGVRPEVVEQLVECLNRDILPRIPERGSVGASGDLVPLSYVAATLTGQGTVTRGGEVTTAAAALAEAGLRPVELAGKDGLALVNGTSFMAGFAALALSDAAELAFVADLCTALASQVLAGNPEHFDEFLYQEKPHRGAMRSAALVRRLLQGSTPEDRGWDPMRSEQGVRELPQPLQDRYSIRCAPHVTGVLRDTVAWAEEWLTVEINSANDNPLFDVETGTVHNGGNFYGGHVGAAMDALKSAVASVGDLLDRQLELAVDEKFNNGLTPNLIPRVDPDSWEAGLHHGFKGMQLCASALVAEALKWTTPATSFSRSTEAHNQDKVSMGSIAARDARSVVELIAQTAAIHLIALCQAADLRGVERLSDPTRAAYRVVRAVSPFLDGDRPLDRDIERVTEVIAAGELRSAVEHELVDR
jgi:phenylalanine ammonia-lyase